MYPVQLKVTKTDIAMDRRTKEPLPFRDDSPQFDEAKHDTTDFYYRDFFRTVLNNPLDPRQGFTPDDTRLSVGILKKMKKTANDETLYLDREHWAHLNAKVQNVAVMFMDLWIAELREYVAGLEPIPDEKIGEAVAQISESQATNGKARAGKLVAV